MKRWESLPTWWNPKEGPYPLVDFKGGGNAGTSLAALRVLLAVSVCDRNTGDYDAWTTSRELEELTGMSRNLVLRGISRAVEGSLLRYEAGGSHRKSRFTLVHPAREAGEKGGWARIPVQQIRTKLAGIPMRGQAPLAAVKLYLLLLANRPNASNIVLLSHERMRTKSGAQTSHIRSGLSLLANAGLIHISNELDVPPDVVSTGGASKPARKGYASAYRLVGDFGLSGPGAAAVVREEVTDYSVHL